MYLVFAIIAGVIGGVCCRSRIRVELHVSRASQIFARDRIRYNVFVTVARPDHDLLHGHAGDDRRLRQLVRAADDRRAGHGLPAHEQHLVLAAAGLLRAAADLDLRRGRAGRQRRRRRLDASTRRSRPRAIRAGGGFRDPVAAPRRRLARSSAPSTSSPPSSTCARRA